VIGALIVVLVGTRLVSPAAAEPRKTILLVFDEDPDFPGLSVIDSNLRETFKAGLPGGVEFCSEALNLSQFKNPGYEGVLRDYFRRKYASKRVDLIVAVMQPALDFVRREAPSIFPGVPIVFTGLDSSSPTASRPPPNVTGVVVKRNFAPTLDVALRLKPDTRRVYVVGGSSPFDFLIETIARRDFAPYEKRLAITYLDALSVSDLLATLSKLPDHSVVLYLGVFRDGAGRAFVPHELVAPVAAAANAPVFVSLDQFLDRGAVGGHVYNIGRSGQQAAEIGLRVMRGEMPPVVEQATYEDVFDWRQLRRWGFDEKRLPPGSEIRYRTRSLWELYRRYILGGVLIFLLQSALIVALVVSLAQRRRADAAAREAQSRRQEAEQEARRQREELAHALRVTTLGELAASFAHELGQPLTAILANAQAVHRLASSRKLTAEELDETLGDIESDTIRAAETIHRLRALVRKDHKEWATIDLNRIVDDVVRLLHMDLQVKDIHVEFHRAETMPRVVADPIQLRQVVLNLLVNAEDALSREPAGKREIHIETAWPGDGAVEVVVRDNGSGAPDEVLEQMFERFTTTKADGLGMGLAISRSIVEAHGGRIWATRNEGRGLSLHVKIPTTPARQGSSNGARP
jgi:signal transduction histidine kinase